MSKRLARLVLLVSLALAVAAGCAPAAKPAVTPSPAAAAASADPLDQPVPLDSRLKKGTLENGLTYYILPHQKPEKRAQLWLAVNAGSVLEDDDQQGLAHFLEHMGFNGTKRFPKQELVKFIESIGVQFGPDLNAYTSFDQTVYMLQVPTDKPELVQKAFFVLRDWAGDVSLEEEEVAKERGVVLEEWRLGRGAQRRIFDKQSPVIFHDSKYAQRIPIGKPEIIQGATREKLLRFYEDWYRPDLMAVIAVGDFDAADIEKKIRAEFGDLKNPATPRPRPKIEVPPHKETLVTIETDPEMPRSSVSVLTKMPYRSEKTRRDFRRGLVEGLYASMINSRLDEVRRRPGAPFLGAGVGASSYVRTMDAFTQFASVKDDGVEAGLAAVLEEVARVEKHGFLQAELERAKADMLRSMKRGVQERDKTDARTFAGEITRNFFEDEAMGGPEAELAMAESFLPGITLAELDALATVLTAGGANRVISVSGPDKMTKPSPESLRAIASSVAGKELAAWEDAVSDAPLVPSTPAAGTITKTETVPEIGVTVWTLSNGARVIHKETDFKNDEVLFAAWSPGGHSLVKDPDFETARYADTVVREGGAGTFDANTLRKALTGKVAYVGAGIGELEETLSGSASPEDLVTMLQLVRLRFTGARKDKDAFTSWREREVELVKNRRLNPETAFNEDYYTFLAQNHPRRMPVTPETLARVDFEKSFTIYEDRFGDAGDFTFLFVGNVKRETLEPLVATWIASLPTKGRKETWKDTGVTYPKGVKTKVVEAGSEPKARVILTFHGSHKWSEEAENDIRMVGEILRFRLREVLREDMGGVYGVSVGGGIWRRPREEYSFAVSFGCAPENVEKLKAAVFAEIEAIQKNGIGDEYLQKLKEGRVRAHEVSLRENRFWLGELRRAYTYGDDPRAIPDISKDLAAVSSDRVRAATKEYLNRKQYVEGVLLPAKP